MASANQEQRDYWNRDEVRHWVDQQRRYDEMLEPFGAAVLDAARIEPDHRVLDVGCGNGATSRAAARIASDGQVLGVDLSEPMLERARALAREEGIDNVSFEVGDAQTRAFEPQFDHAISRFGVMFFDDPPAAFANIRSALRDGGRATFVVWQEALANEWRSVPGAAVIEHVGLPETNDPESPGPFALADPDRTRNLFTQAGFRELTIEPFESSMLLGGRGTLDEAVDFLANTGIGKGLLEDAEPQAAASALAAIHGALEPFVSDEGVRIGSAAWVVSARR
jgi:SAM-dependent methyltransferase